MNLHVRNQSEQNLWQFDGVPGVYSSSQVHASDMGLIWTTSGPHQASGQQRGRCETTSHRAQGCSAEEIKETKV